MKTFEEKWTAWLDGQLSGRELIEFESSLPDLAAAEAEKRDAHKLGAFLKKELAAQPLTNEEFFSHQIRERIARDTEDRHRPTSTWWTVPRLVWCGATALALFVICTVAIVRDHQPGEQSEYLTQILNSRVDPVVNPHATVSIFESKNDNKVTVLWTEGLQSLPADYAAK
jgi:anti-sigma factor RsiW